MKLASKTVRTSPVNPGKLASDCREVVDIVKEPMSPAGVTDEEDLLGVSERWQGLWLFNDPPSAIIGPRRVGEATLQCLERLFHDQVALLVQVDVN